MPTSEHWQIPWVMDLVTRENPRTVLDVGAGFGKYGVLTREFVEPERLDAIDVNEPRFAVYDHLYQGDLRGIDELLPADHDRYDLALFIEAIEHFEKDEGWRILDSLCRHARHVLVSTPWGFRPQEIPGQPFETHRSGWYPWQFRKRYHVHATRIFPGHLSRHLRIPKLWQFIVLVSARK
jgi:hypothetical protein